MNKQEELIAGIREGHRKVLSDIYKQNLPKISRYVERNSGSTQEAEDVFQDAIIVVHRKFQNDQFTLSCTVETYLFAVSKNIWQSRLRRKKRMVQQTKELDEIELDGDVFRHIEQNERFRIYKESFEKLSDECKKVLSMFFDGAKMKDIAEEMGYSESYARKKKFECKSKLVDLVKAEPGFNELATTND